MKNIELKAFMFWRGSKMGSNGFINIFYDPKWFKWVQKWVQNRVQMGSKQGSFWSIS